VFRWLAAGAAVAVALPLALLLLVTATPAASQASTNLAGGPSVLALQGIPPVYLTLYMSAARTCPGLPWGVLANCTSEALFWYRAVPDDVKACRGVCPQIAHKRSPTGRVMGWVETRTSRNGKPRYIAEYRDLRGCKQADFPTVTRPRGTARNRVRLAA
jgi:hypothetical protein